MEKPLDEILEKMTDDGQGVLAVPGTEEERKDMDRLMKEFIKKDKEKRLRANSSGQPKLWPHPKS